VKKRAELSESDQIILADLQAEGFPGIETNTITKQAAIQFRQRFVTGFWLNEWKPK
jgi:nucleolar GTP-binding protein